MEAATTPTRRRRKKYPKYVQVMGTTEVAEALGVAHQNMKAIVGFPEPEQQLNGTRVWRADKLIDFAVDYRERTGKPPLNPLEFCDGRYSDEILAATRD